MYVVAKFQNFIIINNICVVYFFKNFENRTEIDCVYRIWKFARCCVLRTAQLNASEMSKRNLRQTQFCCYKNETSDSIWTSEPPHRCLSFQKSKVRKKSNREIFEDRTTQLAATSTHQRHSLNRCKIQLLKTTSWKRDNFLKEFGGYKYVWKICSCEINFTLFEHFSRKHEHNRKSSRQQLLVKVKPCAGKKIPVLYDFHIGSDKWTQTKINHATRFLR